MLVGVGSVKGSPGVTSTCLALAASWPRPVVLLEADPAGADLTFRCRAAHGGALHERRSILTLAAAARAATDDQSLAIEHSQRLSCGVDVIPGFLTRQQSRGLGELWVDIATACRCAQLDVVVDMGRVEPRSPHAQLLGQVDGLVLVGSATLSGAVHLAAGAAEMVPVIPQVGGVRWTVPALVGPDSTARADREDLDSMVGGSDPSIRSTVSIPFDSATLVRLERGERFTGRLGRSLLARSTRRIAQGLLDARSVST